MTVLGVRIALTALLLAPMLPLSLAAQPASQAAPPSATTSPAGIAPVAPAPATASPPASAAPATPAPGAAPAVPAAAAPGAGPAPAGPPAPLPAWLPRQTAELQIVEKVDATHRTLDVPVGSSAKVDTLVIEVKACVVRPPTEQRDAAAYLDITGKNAPSPLFQGWMLAAEPAASLFEDPLYDVRVTGCR